MILFYSDWMIAICSIFGHLKLQGSSLRRTNIIVVLKSIALETPTECLHITIVRTALSKNTMSSLYQRMGMGGNKRKQ